MSSSEAAADRLRQSLSGLVPSLLNALSDLRQSRPQDTLLPFVQVNETLKPLIDTHGVKEAFGVVETLSSADKDSQEVRIRNLCLEIANNELRRVVLEDPTSLIASPEGSVGGDDLEGKLVSTFDRLDAILALSLHDLIDPTLPLSLIEELIESQPIPTCSRIFGYAESRVKPLTIDLSPTRGKGLVLLRTCNELLRRLSKPSQEQTVFAGRILSLLAAVVPLGDRSGVNLRGDFNVENKTIIEEKAEGDAEEIDDVADKDERDQIFKVDYEFYELFWKVQRLFSNPPLLMSSQESSRPSTRSATPADADHEDPAPEGAKGAMAELRISTRKILKLFGAVTKREKELAGAAMAEEAKSSGNKSANTRNGSGISTPSSNKRKGENGNGAAATGFFVGQSIGDRHGQLARKRAKPDVVDGAKTGAATGDNAMADEDDGIDSQEQVSANGVHFFPTYLTGRKLFEYEIRDTSFRKHILVQYLVLFQYLLSFTPAAKEGWKDWKNKALQALFTLEEADERWIRSTWREIQGLIREIQPDGRLFLESVLEVLKREANWIRWKTNSCPSIEKPPLTPEQISAFASARALLLRKPEPYPHKLGTAALSELWADGLKPPVAGTRRVENEDGEYVTVATDGLEELEIMPAIPSTEHYNKSIQREKMKLNMRKKQLGIDPAVDESGLSKEQQDKLDKDERTQATIETMQSLAWRALRVASRDNLHLLGKPDRPENIEGLLKAIEEERNPKPKSAAKPQAPAADAMADQGSESTSKEEAEPGAKIAAEKADTTADQPVSEAVSAEQVASAESSVPVAVPPVPASPLVESKGGVGQDDAEEGEEDDTISGWDEEAVTKRAGDAQDVEMSEAA